MRWFWVWQARLESCPQITQLSATRLQGFCPHRPMRSDANLTVSSVVQYSLGIWAVAETILRVTIRDCIPGCPELGKGLNAVDLAGFDQ